METQNLEVSNRRKAQRVEGCMEVYLESINRLANARVTDLSEEGCYIDSIGEVTNGESIRLLIHLPTGAEVNVKGVVTHRVPHLGFGVRFVDLQIEQVNLLKEALIFLDRG